MHIFIVACKAKIEQLTILLLESSYPSPRASTKERSTDLSNREHIVTGVGISCGGKDQCVATSEKVNETDVFSGLAAVIVWSNMHHLFTDKDLTVPLTPQVDWFLPM